MGKVRQRLGKAYIHTKEKSIQGIIIDALVNHGYDVDVEVTDNGINEVVSCDIYRSSCRSGSDVTLCRSEREG